MAKRMNNESILKKCKTKRNNKGNRRNNGRESTDKKEELMIFGVLIIVILGILGGYFLYERNSDNNSTEQQNLMDLNDNNNNKNLNTGSGENGPVDNNGGNNGGSGISNRAVLVEAFTSVDCYWCTVEEEPALELIADDYSRDEVIIITYHGFYGDDPYEIPENVLRGNFYGGISGTPTLYFDGLLKQEGGTGYGVNAMYDVLVSKQKERAAVESHLDITLSGTISSGSVALTAEVSELSSVDTSGLSIRFAILEDGLKYDGRTFNWVLRDITDQSISGVTFPQTFTTTFDLDPAWNSENLGQ